jgi:hypothetical protein
LSARSGCRGLLIGLESIDQGNLTECRKGFNRPERFPELVETLHRHGIALQGCFVFGLDHDTPDVFLKTARLAVEAKIDLPRFAVVTPFPGTPLFRRLEGEGRILTRNWELYDGQHVVFQPARMTVEELQRGIEQAWRHAYSFPSIARRLAASPSPWAVRLGANLGYRFYAHNLHRFYNCDWIVGGAGAQDGEDGGGVRLTLVHPCIGRRRGQPYIRTWQMEPLPPALIAGLTPRDVEVRFYDDRMEEVPVRRAHRPRGPVRRDVHREARLPDRLGIPPARRARGDGRIPREPLPGGGRAVR